MVANCNEFLEQKSCFTQSIIGFLVAFQWPTGTNGLKL